MNVGIILAAGNSNRYKHNIPKQFQSFNNKMLVEYSLNTFLNHSEIDEVLLLVPNEYYNFIKDKIKKCKLIIGGKTRQESSLIALNNCSKETKNVLIHDAARPFVDSSIISNCINSLKSNVAVCPALSCTDTIATVQNDKINKVLNRSKLFHLQTPQAFDYSILFECHKKIREHVTDDISVIQKCGYTPKIIPGSKKNMKITYNEDFEIIKTLI
tara:strand:+ start:171 stop:812 length:642 start_codon:yes stop_codon:yes gene_type:complete